MKDSGKHKIRYKEERQKKKKANNCGEKSGTGKVGVKDKDKDNDKDTQKHNIPQRWWKEKRGRGKLGSKDKHCRLPEASQWQPERTSPFTLDSKISER